MKKIALLLILLISFSSCKSSKRAKNSAPKTTKTTKTTDSKTADKIVKYAMQFDGVRYKYGGTTKKGMDCSGLVTTVFQSENIQLPRTTGSMATTGDWIDLKEVQKGDLLFFATSKNSRKVNHVALVTEARGAYVEFIHASTSKGVIISNLAERYWYYAFVQARRVL
ncbi:C40 family peptidase [Mangrovimonas sp. DI 80]|uniref:C40 family peptidase n=1 Tax=Mangrovimonas sp. DI 80 TaxID=1779330 RepID=UPI00097543FB|nr:C40 family peptidase [Mangrovimonas sp. DI 80]OMP31832.1 glycoside hydrolase [Mangrovimonas sp. DI 80]